MFVICIFVICMFVDQGEGVCFWEKSIYKGEDIYKGREFRIRAFKIVLLKKKKNIKKRRNTISYL